jgi:hypothetical protein
MLISFPDNKQDVGIEFSTEGPKIFFHMATVRAAAGEPIAVRLMYRLLLDGARRSQLQRYGDVASHIWKQLTAEFGTDPRAVPEDARMVPEFPSLEELRRAIMVLYPERPLPSLDEDDPDEAAEFDAEEDETDEILLEDDEELEYEADAEDDEEIDDIDAFEDDEPEAFTAEAEDEDKPPAPDDEPVRIRQRYARR